MADGSFDSVVVAQSLGTGGILRFANPSGPVAGTASPIYSTSTQLQFQGGSGGYALRASDNSRSLVTVTDAGHVSIVGPNNNATLLTLTQSHDSLTSNDGSYLSLRRSRGTNTSPAAVKAGDFLGYVSGLGHDGSAYGYAGYIQFNATQAWTPSAHGGDIRFFTTPENTTATAPRMTIAHDGKVGIGTTTPERTLDILTGTANIRVRPITGTSVAYQEFGNTGGTLFLGVEGSTGSGLLGIGTPYDAAIGSGAATGLRIATTNTTRIYIEPDGDVGIGTTAPGARMHVAQPVSGVPAAKVHHTGNIINPGNGLAVSNGYAAFGPDSGSGNYEIFGVYAQNFTDRRFAVLDNGVVNIGNAGVGSAVNIGGFGSAISIGGPTYTWPDQVGAAGQYLRLSSVSGNTANLAWENQSSPGTSYWTQVIDQNGGRLYPTDSAVNVGIGTIPNPAANNIRLDVLYGSSTATAGSTAARLHHQGDAGHPGTALKVSNGYALTSAGNREVFGVYAYDFTSPLVSVRDSGETVFGGPNHNGTAQTGISLRAISGGATYQVLALDAGGNQLVGHGNNNMLLRAFSLKVVAGNPAGTKLFVTGDGNVGIGTGDATPAARLVVSGGNAIFNEKVGIGMSPGASGEGLSVQTGIRSYGGGIVATGTNGNISTVGGGNIVSSGEFFAQSTKIADVSGCYYA